MMPFFAVTITDSKGLKYTICLQAKTEAHAISYVWNTLTKEGIRFWDIEAKLAHTQTEFEQGE